MTSGVQINGLQSQMELQEQITNLKSALKREKSSRKIAEQQLEKKSSDLFKISEELQQANQQIKALSSARTSDVNRAHDIELNRLKDQHEKLKILLDNSPAGLFLSNPMGNGLVFSNDAVGKILGLTTEQLKTENVAANVHPDDQPRLLKAQNAMHSGEKDAFSIKIRMLNKEGKIVWIKLSLNSVRDASGKVICEVGIAEDITIEKKLNGLLKEQQDRLEILLNNSHLGITLSKDKGQVVILANTAASKMLGLNTEELMSANIGSTIHPDDVLLVQKELNAMYNGDIDNYNLKVRFYTKKKNIIWVKLFVSAVRDESGMVKYEVVTFEDITKEKELNDRVKLSEMLLTNLVSDAPIGILMINEFGMITLANKKLCDIFQLEATPEQLVGYDGSMLAEKCKLVARNPNRFVQKIKQLHERKSFLYKEEVEFTDGRVFERHCMPLSYQGKDKGLLVSYTNITAVKDFEHKLQEQKEKYATVFANMNLGWTEVDRDGYILTANKSFCKLTGYTMDELIGKHGGEFLLAQDPRDRLKYYNDKESNVYESHSIQIKTKSGKIKHLLVSGIRTNDSNGELASSIGIQFDITEHKELELQKEELLKKLASQNEQLNDYAHVVSHDLKSPLRSISALLSWTKEDYSEKLGEAGLKNLNLIEEKVEKMDLLIENILQYSRLDNTQLNNVTVDVNLVIKDILGMIFIPKGVRVNIINKLPVLFADAARMQQLFQNLITNAANHVDKNKGEIEIDYIDADTHYQFAIKDNGRGIKKEYHEKIFKAFKSFDDRDMSTGIGLSIVKNIIDQYDGEIWFESEVGMGTTFFFTIKKQA